MKSLDGASLDMSEVCLGEEQLDGCMRPPDGSCLASLLACSARPGQAVQSPNGQLHRLCISRLVCLALLFDEGALDSRAEGFGHRTSRLGQPRHRRRRGCLPLLMKRLRLTLEGLVYEGLQEKKCRTRFATLRSLSGGASLGGRPSSLLRRGPSVCPSAGLRPRARPLAAGSPWTAPSRRASFPPFPHPLTSSPDHPALITLTFS
jgi:hypothetical protein